MKALQRFVLNEIGNSRNPYRYKLKINEYSGEGKALFQTDNGYRYWVEMNILSIQSESVEINFGIKPTKDKNAFDLTNAGLQDAFRVMATVIAALREYLTVLYKKHQLKIGTVVYWADDTGKSNDKAMKQRDKLYVAYIKKEKDVSIEYRGAGRTIIRIEDSFYK